MENLNLCPLCGAPAPAPPAVTCRYCKYTWASPAAAPAASAQAPARPPAAPTPTFVGLSFDEVLASALRHLTGFSDIYFASSTKGGRGIPEGKERGAREAHAGHLPPDEPLVALFDSTLLGGGDEGYVITARRFCWKPAFFNPQALPWRLLDVSTVCADGTDVKVMGHSVGCVYKENSDGLTALLIELASEAQRRAPAPAPRPQGGSDHLVDLMRRHLGVHDDLFFAPAIPSKKEANARRVHGLSAEQPLVALYDGTVFGSAEEGFVVTSSGLHWKTSFEDPRSVAWSELRADRVAQVDDDVSIDGHKLGLLNLKPEQVRAFLLAVAAKLGCLRALAGREAAGARWGVGAGRGRQGERRDGGRAPPGPPTVPPRTLPPTPRYFFFIASRCSLAFLACGLSGSSSMAFS